MDKVENIPTEPTKEDMIDIQKQHKKGLYDLLFPPGNPEFESIEENYKEMVAHKPFVEGRLVEGD